MSPDPFLAWMVRSGNETRYIVITSKLYTDNYRYDINDLLYSFTPSPPHNTTLISTMEGHIAHQTHTYTLTHSLFTTQPTNSSFKSKATTCVQLNKLYLALSYDFKVLPSTYSCHLYNICTCVQNTMQYMLDVVLAWRMRDVWNLNKPD